MTRRQPGLRKKPLSASIVRTSESLTRITDGLRPEHITKPLVQARDDPAEFRDSEWKWLGSNVPPLDRAARGLIELSLKESAVTIEDAQAALSGVLLGSAVLRGLIEEGLTSLSECRVNFSSYEVGERGIVYDGYPNDRALLAKVFEPEVVDAFEQIAYPAARTLCSMVVGIGLIPFGETET